MMSVAEKAFVLQKRRVSLLSAQAIKALGLLTLNAVSYHKAVCSPKEEFPTLFSPTLGKFGTPYRIKLTDNGAPYSVRFPRRVPYPLYDAVQRELKAMVQAGVIKQVYQPTDWCAPMVVVKKKTPGAIRICVDLTMLNQCVKRERHILPTVESSLAKLSGAKVFSKLD